MTPTISFLVLAGGCIYLLIGGDFIVRGALALAAKASISPALVGLTVVALGTSAPELIVSVYAAVSGHPGIAVGNVVGSNISNVFLVLGLPSLITAIAAKDAALRPQAVAMLLVSLTFVGMAYDGIFSRVDGIALLLALSIGTWLTLRGQLQLPGLDIEEAEQEMQRVVGLPSTSAGIALLIVLGCGFLQIGARLTTNGAVEVAEALQVSGAAIGSTLVALGTSLPELSTTLIAAFRRSADMAIGNVIGSNLLNILLIMGITSTVIAVPVPAHYLTQDLLVFLASAVALSALVWVQASIGRMVGIIFCAAYIGYYALVY